MTSQDPAKLSSLSWLIFSSRWMQLPLYLGLIVAQGVYVILFVKELFHLIMGATSLSEQLIMLAVLGLIDVVMISNLLVMVIVGGYETFVSRLNLQGHPDQPEWLSHVNASVLKVKLAMAIIGISSIHLLKTFIAIGSLGCGWFFIHRNGCHVANHYPYGIYLVGNRDCMDRQPDVWCPKIDAHHTLICRDSFTLYLDRLRTVCCACSCGSPVV
jgi:uncharacterized protein (TIGR00645 family)